MGWESRKRGGRYYTRSRREGDRVVREYIGGGKLGQAVAFLDRKARDERARQAQRERAARDEDAALVALVDEFDRAVRALVAAELVAAGYHRHHRGAWRRKRG